MKILDTKLEKHINLLLERYPQLSAIKIEIVNAYLLLEHAYNNSGKLLIAGNGGSSADADHIVGELMKGFKMARALDREYKNELISVDEVIGARLAEKLQGCLPAINLANHTALNSAYLNDIDAQLCYAQQVNGYGKPEDIFLGITTSGNSENIISAAVVARAKGMKVIGLTGTKASRLSEFADVAVKVPEMETYMVQELHLPIYHCWCLMLEEKFWLE